MDFFPGELSGLANTHSLLMASGKICFNQTWETATIDRLFDSGFRLLDDANFPLERSILGSPTVICASYSNFEKALILPPDNFMLDFTS